MHRFKRSLHPRKVFAFLRWSRLKKMHKNTRLALILCAILLLVGIWAALFNQNSAVQDLTQQSNEDTTTPEINTAESVDAAVSFVQGTVEYKDETGTWSSATPETIVTSGNGIRTTGASSRAVIKFLDGSVLRVDANSEVLLETVADNRIIIRHENGYAYHRTVPSNTRTYIVETENGQFQAAGTAFRTSATGDEESADVFQSSVKETRSNLTAKEGEKVVAKSNNNPTRDGTIEKLDIEKIKTDSFIVWNREQDQQDATFKKSLGFLSDFDGPTISITQPTAGSSIEMSETATAGAVTISGTTEAKGTLTVQSKSVQGNSPINIPINEDGTFTSPELPAVLGSSLFEFVATDRVGNKSTLAVTYSFKRKSSAAAQNISVFLTEADNKVNISWTLSGITTPNGIYVIWDDEPNPTFSSTSPDKQLVSSGNNVALNTNTFDKNKRYYVSVCRYSSTTDTCDIYSTPVTYERE